jgi:probable rRNA maturation factor
MSKIAFQQHEISIRLRNRLPLKDFIKSLFKKEKKVLEELNYIFCTDEYLLTINQQSLNHNYYTDIITFDLSNHPKAIIGEIYISIDRVKDNAKVHHSTFTNELHRVIFHGALHLCGYKDKTKADVTKMRGKENFYLSKYFKQL